MSKGALDRLRGTSFEDMLAQIGMLEWYEFQHDRATYEYFYNEPYSRGVLRAFGQAMAVAAYAGAVFALPNH